MKVMQRILVVSAVAWGLTLPPGAFAQPAAGAAAAPSSESASSVPWTDGEIKKIDAETGKVTIKHGPIQNLGMPAMTMVFKAKSKTDLARLQAGDKVQFVASDDNGELAVDQIRTAR